MRRRAIQTARAALGILPALAILLSAGCEKKTGATSSGPAGSGRAGSDATGSKAAQALPIVRTATGEMVRVPAGWFMMGSDEGEPDERPARKVWLDAFLIDRFEVTQEQFRKLATRDDPSLFKGDGHPVENLTWPAVALWCNARSRAEGLDPCYDEGTGECNFEADGYRLPTEAEWEYACRAGSDTPYSFGRDARHLGDYAWFRDNSRKKTHPVGTKRPNPWGIHDLCGNVAEWCNDVYDAATYRNAPARNPRGAADHAPPRLVVRGGAWNASADACRSARRAHEDPGQILGCFSRGDVGFRCVRRVPAEAP